MGVHIGEKIKTRAKELRIGPTELGKMINTSKQNIYGIFKRKSIDAELLKKISEALDFDFFQLYMEQKGNSGLRNKNKQELSRLEEELKAAKKDLIELKEKYELLKKVNELLEKNYSLIKKTNKQ